MEAFFGTVRNQDKARRGPAKGRADERAHPTPHHTLPVGLATWIGFAMMCVGMFMAILDIQVVATSLPTIQHALTSRRTR